MLGCCLESHVSALITYFLSSTVGLSLEAANRKGNGKEDTCNPSMEFKHMLGLYRQAKNLQSGGIQGGACNFHTGFDCLYGKVKVFLYTFPY